MIVSNSITGDSRVQKTALSAAHAGWEVLLLGRSTSEGTERAWLGPVKVVRVPVGTVMRDRETQRRRRTVRARLLQAGLATKEDAALLRRAHEAHARRRGELIGRFTGPHASPLSRASQFGLKAWRRLAEEGFALRSRAFDWEEEHHPDPDRVIGDWRRDWPALLDLDLAFGPVIEEFDPAVIHANDVTMLNVGATTAGRMRAAGREVTWLYDAHEYVAGVDWPSPRMMSAYPAVERALIRQADAVVTVSPEIADLIRQENQLEQTPLVVRNTPVRTAIGTSSASVRVAAGVPQGVPLLVYSGYIHPERGIGTAVAALPDLPGVHLAIVSGRVNAELRATLRLADELQVRERVHVVPYVAQHEVADYLRSADVGVISSVRTINYELSLPTKLAEYLHAGLPVVVSDVQQLSAFVRTHGVGTVFESGDTGSFRDAALTVLQQRDALAGAITPPILEELSWEHQVTDLLRLYTELSGTVPPPPAEPADWNVLERPRSARGPRRGSQTPWRHLGATPIKLGLGPANFAGQLSAIAQAVTTARPDVSAEVFVRNAGSPFHYPADVQIPARRLERLDGQVEQLNRILPRYTHLIADAFRPVFGTLNGTDIGGDLPALASRNIKVALLSHGSDVRDPDRHMESTPFSLFFDAPPEVVAERRAKALRSRRIVQESDLPVFVTTPDLLDDMPGATWLPLVVDVEAWATDNPVMERSRPVVLHAPSKRWTKGTDRFMGQLEAMDRRGLIEFQLIENLPWAEMRERVQNADLVLDQFAIGSYGALACEAMAAGRPVLAWLSDAALSTVGDAPIVNTPPDGVAAAVEGLLDQPERVVQLGIESRDYARRVHDGREAVQRLSGFLTP